MVTGREFTALNERCTEICLDWECPEFVRSSAFTRPPEGRNSKRSKTLTLVGHVCDRLCSEFRVYAAA